MTIDLDSNGAFTSAYNTLKTLMLSVFDWLMHITIGGVPLLYINLGFVLLITLFAILLPVLRNSGANELNSIGSRFGGRSDSASSPRPKSNQISPREADWYYRHDMDPPNYD